MIKEELHEGTWAVPKNIGIAISTIAKVKKLQKEVYKIFGDDEVMDCFDSATRRMEDLIDFLKKDGKL